MPRNARSIALALAIAGSAAAAPAAADEPTRDELTDPTLVPPAGAPTRLVLTGAAIAVGWYAAGTGMSFLFPDAPGANDLRIPVAGPWMALADTGCADNDPGCSGFTVAIRAILTVMDGVGQAGGLLLVGEGLFLPSSGAARAPAPRRRSSVFHPTQVRATPMVGRHSFGLGLGGRF